MKQIDKHNKKMLGKQVLVDERDEPFRGIVDKIIDEQTFLVKDYTTGETRKANIFDIRSI